MDLQQKTLRVGLMAILCAAVFRLCTVDFAQYLPRLRQSSLITHFITYLETGHDVRFSPSSESFSPDFVETPHPFIPWETSPVLPLFDSAEAVDVQYFVTAKPDLQELIASPLQWELSAEEPTVLIIHTHSTESYTPGGKAYPQTASYRTLEEDYNMLRIGQAVAQILNESGIPALQDRSIHDYPSYNGAYSSSRKAVEDYLKEYPSIQLVLDLHRDASEGSGSQLRTLAHVDGERSAQLMVVIGANHKGYTENLALGLKLHAQLETQSPGITRPLQLRSQRFNQDLLPGSLLIEVGAAGNTQEEALQAAHQLARAIVALGHGTRVPEAPEDS